MTQVCHNSPSLVGAGRAGRDVYARLNVEDSAAGLYILNRRSRISAPLIVTAAHSTLTHCTVSGWVGPCLDASKDPGRTAPGCLGVHGVGASAADGAEQYGGEGRAEGRLPTGLRRMGRGRSVRMGHGKLALSGRCEGFGSDELGGMVGLFAACFVLCNSL